MSDINTTSGPKPVEHTLPSKTRSAAVSAASSFNSPSPRSIKSSSNSDSVKLTENVEKHKQLLEKLLEEDEVRDEVIKSFIQVDEDPRKPARIVVEEFVRENELREEHNKEERLAELSEDDLNRLSKHLLSPID